MKKAPLIKIPIVELLYISDDVFKKDVDEIRKKFGIKLEKNGFVSTEDFLNFDQQLIYDKKIRKEYQNDIYIFCKKHQLNDFERDVEIFIESAEAPYQIDYLTEAYQRTNIRKPVIKPRRWSVPGGGIIVTFVIRRYIEQKELELWFRKYKAEILLAVNDHFSGMKPGLRTGRKWERIIKIIKLKEENPKMSFSKIADILCEEYCDDPDIKEGHCNEGSVKQIYHRYKKREK